MGPGDERSRAWAGLSRRRLARAVRRGWFIFTSVRFANLLLMAMLLAGLAGILIPQFGTLTLRDPALLAAGVARLPERYGELLGGLVERFDLYRIFTSWWWVLLVASFT